MTVRKADLSLPPRTPTYVSREIGAAELCISPETWDAMVARGELPQHDYRIGGTMPRWKWANVEAWLSGQGQQGRVDADPYVAAVENHEIPTKGRRTNGHAA
jgi:predicted DNA-binding transcriptional regulator AlpA